MQNAYVLTGNLEDGRTIVLDETLPLGKTRVRIVLEPILSQEPYETVMAEIRERQRLRNHVPRAKDQVDAELQADRDSWDQE